MELTLHSRLRFMGMWTKCREVALLVRQGESVSQALIPTRFGPVAQLGAQHLCKVKVESSNLFRSTKVGSYRGYYAGVTYQLRGFESHPDYHFLFLIKMI